MDLTLPAILGGIIVVLFGLTRWLKHSADKERAKDPPPKKSPPKEECKRLVLAALEAGEPLTAEHGTLVVDQDAQEIWAALPQELTSFLSHYGTVRWDSGGFVGGRIRRVSGDKLLSRFLRKHNYDTGGVIIGADEAETLFALPGQEKIFSAMPSLDRVDVWEHIFELLVACEGLDEADAGR